METKDAVLFAFMSFLFLFASCSHKKQGVKDKPVNPFDIGSRAKTQVLQPCHWSFTVEEIGNGEAVLVSTAKLDSGWYLYSQHVGNKHVRTEFDYDSTNHYNLLGITEEGSALKKFDPYLEMEVLYFEGEAIFKQNIDVLNEREFRVTGEIDYMVCLDQCVKLDEAFTFKVKGRF